MKYRVLKDFLIKVMFTVADGYKNDDQTWGKKLKRTTTINRFK